MQPSVSTQPAPALCRKEEEVVERRRSSQYFSPHHARSVDARDFEQALPSPTFSQTSTAHVTDARPSVASKEGKRSNSTSTTQTSDSTNKDHWLIRAATCLVSVRWRGILALLAGVFAQALCWGLIMTYGTILAFYVRYLIPNTEELLCTLAGAIPPFCLLALAVPWGRLLDAGHHRELNIAAGVLLTGGVIGLAFTGTDDYNSGKYWAIVLSSVPMGTGQSIYFLAAPQMAKTWHPNHKGLAMGITNSGAAIGGVAWPLIFDNLVEDHGFREGVATLAGISGALSMFIIIFAVPAPEFKRRSIGKGNAYNFKTWWPTRAFRSKVFVLHIISMSFIYLGVLTIPFFIEIWARRNEDISVSEDISSGTGIDLDRSKKLGVYLLITLNGCQLPGRLCGSMMCDKIKARKIHAAACLISVIVIASCWFSVTSFKGGLSFASLFGLCLGVMVSLPINDIQDILGNDRTYLLGQYAGAVYTCCCPFILGGVLISAALIQYFDVFIAPAVYTMGCFSAGGVFILIGLLIKDDTVCFEDFEEVENEPCAASAFESGQSTRANSVIEPGDVNRRTSDSAHIEKGFGNLGDLQTASGLSRRATRLTRVESLRSERSWSSPESPA